MNWDWIKNLSDSAVKFVDAVFPFWVGKRTAIAALVCPVLGALAPVAEAYAPEVVPALKVAQGVLCGVVVPVAAGAHVLRKK